LFVVQFSCRDPIALFPFHSSESSSAPIFPFCPISVFVVSVLNVFQFLKL
jgi:hypothetical protein